MGTTCCCLGTASVYFCSCWGGHFLCRCDVIFSPAYPLRRRGGQVCVIHRYNVNLTLLVSGSLQHGELCFRSLRRQLDARRIHFCPVSQTVSSPYVTINAYRDTALYLEFQICRGGRSLLAVWFKIGSFFTPACIYSFPTLKASPEMITVDRQYWKPLI